MKNQDGGEIWHIRLGFETVSWQHVPHIQQRSYSIQAEPFSRTPKLSKQKKGSASRVSCRPIAPTQSPTHHSYVTDVTPTCLCHENNQTQNWFKDDTYYCYCAYVLRISRYSDFLMLTNTERFLRGLKLSGKVDLSKYSSYPKRKLGVTMHFLEIMKLQFEKQRHTLLCILKLFTNIIHKLSLKNAWLPPILFLDFNNTCEDLHSLHNHNPGKKISLISRHRP